ncbi:hypothetical protein O9993_01200 [Vibrio lentus]|nr:hypothetical protein [Vibrio lentus]
MKSETDEELIEMANDTILWSCLTSHSREHSPRMAGSRRAITAWLALAHGMISTEASALVGLPSQAHEGQRRTWDVITDTGHPCFWE